MNCQCKKDDFLTIDNLIRIFLGRQPHIQETVGCQKESGSWRCDATPSFSGRPGDHSSSHSDAYGSFILQFAGNSQQQQLKNETNDGSACTDLSSLNIVEDMDQRRQMEPLTQIEGIDTKNAMVPPPVTQMCLDLFAVLEQGLGAAVDPSSLQKLRMDVCEALGMPEHAPEELNTSTANRSDVDGMDCRQTLKLTSIWLTFCLSRTTIPYSSRNSRMSRRKRYWHYGDSEHAEIEV